MGDAQSRDDIGSETVYHRARASDPHPSHLAAEEVERTGRAETQKAQILKVLKECECPVTSLEISVMYSIDRHYVARRLPELATDGKVRRMGPRKCRAGNRKAVTWEAV